MFAQVLRSPSGGSGSSPNPSENSPAVSADVVSKSDGLVVASVATDQLEAVSQAAQKLLSASDTSMIAMQWKSGSVNKVTIVAPRKYAQDVSDFIKSGGVVVIGVDLKVEGGEVFAGAHLTFNGKITETGFNELRKISRRALSEREQVAPAFDEGRCIINCRERPDLYKNIMEGATLGRGVVDLMEQLPVQGDLIKTEGEFGFVVYDGLTSVDIYKVPLTDLVDLKTKERLDPSKPTSFEKYFR